jgi:hypothetical protein
MEVARDANQKLSEIGADPQIAMLVGVADSYSSGNETRGKNGTLE